MEPVIRFLVENLPETFSEAELKKLFSGCGDVVSIRSMNNPKETSSFGLAVVEVSGNENEGFAAALDGVSVAGVAMRIREMNHSQDIQTDQAAVETGNPPAPRAPLSSSSYRPFRVSSIEAVDGPYPVHETDWHRYVLESGKSNIVGFHRGTVAEIALFAAEAAHGFNLRNQIRGRKPLSWGRGSRK